MRHMRFEIVRIRLTCFFEVCGSGCFGRSQRVAANDFPDYITTGDSATTIVRCLESRFVIF